MPDKQIIKDNIWGQRIPAADRQYEEWENRFRCDILEKYYEGEQWKSQESLGYHPYVINKVYETIQIKIAQFIPDEPEFKVSPIVSEDEDMMEAAQGAYDKEDTLNTIINDDNNLFTEEMEQAYKDSFFRFGMIEVGYDADWILNPNAPKPLLGKDTDINIPEGRRTKIISAPTELPKNERVYFKHIAAKTFRIGGVDHKYLERCGWVGYYEWVDKEDILALPKLKNRDKIDIAFNSRSYEPRIENQKYDDKQPPRGTRKLWHIWDLRAMKRLIVLDTPFVTIYEKGFKRLPLFDLRPDKRLITNGFYPIPTAYHWLSPQNEYNETREMLRAHRRRFIRKYQVLEGRIDDEEIEKFETGPDGGMIKVKQLDAIKAIDAPSLGPELNESINVAADDLDRISGTSREERLQSDRSTATQAKIVQQASQMRQSKEGNRVAKWANRIGREVILLVRDRFTSKTKIKVKNRNGEHFLGSANMVQNIYKSITSDNLDDKFDFNVKVDFVSMSPMGQAEEKQAMLEFLGTLTQFPMVAFSPYLVREIAVRCGYRNEKAIAEFQQMALLMELGRMNQLKAQSGQQQQQQQVPQNGPAGQQIVASQSPNTSEQIRNQLTNQLGVNGSA